MHPFKKNARLSKKLWDVCPIQPFIYNQDTMTLYKTPIA